MAEPTNDSAPSLTLSPTALHISKLHRINYPVWKAQIVPYLIGQEAFGYVDGSIPPPPSTITNAVGTLIANPAFKKWTRQDNLVLSIINSSLTEEIIAQISNNTTSATVWTALEKCFAAHSRAKVVQLRSQLATARKAGSTITEYFMTIKRLVDELAIAGHPISTDDSITYLLSGLGPEYDSLITVISSQTTTTIDDLFSQLLTTEARINHHNSPSPASTLLPPNPNSSNPTPITPVANLNTHSYYPSPNRDRSTFNRGRGRSNYRGRMSSMSSRPNYNQNAQSTVTCQICTKTGHVASNCWWRYDQQTTQQRSRPNPPSASYHTYNDNTPSRPPHEWLPDTGATHHMTNDMNNLTLGADEYTGSDRIHSSNGSGLLGPYPS